MSSFMSMILGLGRERSLPNNQQQHSQGKGKKGNDSSLADVEVVMRNGFILSKKYELVKPLGKGTYGHVHLAKKLDRDGKEESSQLYAVKGMQMRNLLEMGSVYREISFMSQLVHPNIVQYNETLFQNNCAFLVMEYLPRDLGHHLRSAVVKRQLLSDDLVLSYTWQLLNGLDFLHCNNIIHRDLKPTNLLIDKEGSIKITDFGLSCCFIPTEKYSSNMYTPQYRPIELLLGSTTYDSSADMWSAGCIVIEMLTNRMAFPSCESDVLIRIMQVFGVPNALEYPPECKERYQGESRKTVHEAFPEIPTRYLSLLEGLMTYSPRERWCAYDAKALKVFDPVRDMGDVVASAEVDIDREFEAFIHSQES
eukprot:m.74768 g.74768  ORF g.74768 m.74768 type:complete len:366 (+) comp8460_c0_seq2:83-1180(+)